MIEGIVTASIDDLIGLRCLIDEEILRRSGASSPLYQFPPNGLQLGLQRSFGVLGIILQDRAERSGERVSIELRDRRDLTAWVRHEEVYEGSSHDVIDALRAIDARLGLASGASHVVAA